MQSINWKTRRAISATGALPKYGLVVLVGSARDEVLSDTRRRARRSYVVAWVATLCTLAASAALIFLLGRQRRMINKLARNEARFRATFDQAAVGICEVGPDARLLRVNRRLCSNARLRRGRDARQILGDASGR